MRSFGQYSGATVKASPRASQGRMGSGAEKVEGFNAACGLKNASKTGFGFDVFFDLAPLVCS
jgi:hypothetical protein